MKTSLRLPVALWLCFSASLLHAQSTANSGNAPSLPAPTPYSIVQQDANSQVWESTVYELDPSGQAVPRKHRYTELATGLNHLVDGQWVPSKEEIDVSPDGNSAAATNGQHQVFFPGNIYNGVIELDTPDGLKLQSQPIGLGYDDGTNSVLIAVLTNSTGAILPTGNQVVYQNAFTGFNADLLYTYTKAGFEQDVVIRTEPPTPESLGLNSATAKLQILTEFFNPPTPTTSTTTLPEQAGVSITDQTLDFGVMRIGLGRAFMIGDDASTADVLVGKQWVQVGNRQLLVEEIPVEAVANQLGTLPLPQGASTKTGTATHPVASSHWQLPPLHLIQAGAAGPFRRVAQITVPTHGLVLDYITVTSQTNTTFQGDTTYYVSGTANLSGINTFEGGAVIKYTNGASIVLQSTNLNWLTAAYHPVIFTAKDDNRVGDPINGSTGVPTNYYANPALSISVSGLNLSNFCIAYAKQAILGSSGSPISTTLYDCQFVNCLNGLAPVLDSYEMWNALFANVQTNFNNILDGGADVQNGTFDRSACIGTLNSGGGVTLTNCILSNVTNLGFGGLSVSGNYNGFYNSPPFGTSMFTNAFYPFQVVGAGNYYLTNGCNFFNQGTTNIDSTLLAALQTKTTYPPLVYSNTTISVPMTFNPQAQRDTDDTPDLGYHYDPLDYVFGGVIASSNLAFTVGTAVGWFELPGSGGPGYGISLLNDVNATFTGTATSPCVFARYATVQEGGNGLWKDKGWLAGLEDGGNYDTNNPASVTASFTHFTRLAGDPNHIRDGQSGQPIVIHARHCEFYGGFGGYNMLGAYTNCLFYRGGTGITSNNHYPYQILVNCTFYGGSLNFSHDNGSAPYWPSYVHNCAFDNTTFSIDDPFGSNTNYADYNYNSFDQGAAQLPTEGANTVIVTNGYNWQSSWLGNFYLPTNSPLIIKGDRTADQIGLYHFTTQTNQTIEADSQVDIGYHYVAVDTNGIPLDNNGDGIPDYLEDANGNGLVDSGEIGWNIVGDLGLKVIITRPRNGSILP